LETNRVLILDDDVDILTFLRHELAKKQFAVDTATQSDEALQLLRKNHYICAIVDIVLGPNKTSDSVIQFFKKGPDCDVRKTPLIITSAFMKQDYAEKLEMKGINVYRAITKPFRPGQMSEILVKLQSDIEQGLFTPMDPSLFEDEADEIPIEGHNEDMYELDDSLIHVKEVKQQKKINQAFLAKEDIHFRNEEGETNLMIFAERGEINHIKNLLALKAPVNDKAKNGRSALHFAILSKNIEVVKLLVEANARIDMQDDGEDTPLSLAIRRGDYPIADYLIGKGARIDMKVRGDPYLILALQCDQMPMFTRLLAAEANPLIKGHSGKDVKQLAKEQNKTQFLRILNTLT